MNSFKISYHISANHYFVAFLHDYDFEITYSDVQTSNLSYDTTDNMVRSFMNGYISSSEKTVTVLYMETKEMYRGNALTIHLLLHMLRVIVATPCYSDVVEIVLDDMTDRCQSSKETNIYYKLGFQIEDVETGDWIVWDCEKFSNQCRRYPERKSNIDTTISRATSILTNYLV